MKNLKIVDAESDYVISWTTCCGKISVILRSYSAIIPKAFSTRCGIAKGEHYGLGSVDSDGCL
jgi:hypothetical protein